MKRTRLIGLLLVAALFLIACNGKEPVRQAAAPVDETGVLKIYHHPQGIESVIVDALLPGFQERYPEYRVQKVPFTEWSQKTFQSGQVHLGWDYFWYPYAEELYMDLRPMVQRDRLDPALLSFGVAEEPVIYGLPSSMMPLGLLYDRAAFQAAGLPEPRPGWTWDDFRAAAKALIGTVDGERVYGHGGMQVELLVRLYLAGLSESVAAADEADVVSAISFFRTMIESDRSIPRPKYRYWNLTPWYHETVDDARVAMMVNYVFPGSAARLGSTWRWAPLPVHPGKQPVGLAQLGGWNLSLQAPDPQAAWNWIKHSVSEQGALALAQAGITPVLQTPAVREAWLKRFAEPGAEFVFDTKWQGLLTVHEKGAREFEMAKALNQAANRVLAEGSSMELALEQYRKDRARILHLPQP